MDILLGWPPNVWAARLLLFLCLAGAVVVLLALLVRLLRPAVLREIASGELPTQRTIKATLRFLGQEFEGRAEVGATEAVQVLALERRIAQLDLRKVWKNTAEF